MRSQVARRRRNPSQRSSSARRLRGFRCGESFWIVWRDRRRARGVHQCPGSAGTPQARGVPRVRHRLYSGQTAWRPNGFDRRRVRGLSPVPPPHAGELTMADYAKSLTLNCPVTLPAGDRVLLGHGSGGKLTADLISKIFVPAFHNSVLDRLDDQAIVSVNGTRLAFTTDSFVVKPLFFAGGDIGSLAVHGTVNDLAMGGARPLFLSTAFIIEEGLPLETLQRVVTSLQTAAVAAGIEIVTGDTKVVEQGSGDELFINTTGIGIVPNHLRLSADQARPGDTILLSGPIGDHGIAILAQRAGLEFESTIVSDSASLYPLVKAMLETGAAIRCMRDPTRGGVSSALNEIAAQSNVGMAL